MRRHKDRQHKEHSSHQSESATATSGIAAHKRHSSKEKIPMSKDDSSTMPRPGRLSRRDFLRHAGQMGLGAAGLSLLAACGGTPAAPTTGGAATAAPAAAAQGGTAQVTISMMGWGSLLEKEN